MSLFVMGLSHHSAPLEVLERAALDLERQVTLGERVSGAEHVDEVMILATCNRLEVYADAGTFHGAVSVVGEALSQVTGLSGEMLHDHLYVHWEDRAVAHLFSLACGLDSMAVGEAEILGQIKGALTAAQNRGQAGPALNSLVQRGLRVGKRIHSETSIDRVSVSLVEAGLSRAAHLLGGLSGRDVLVVGAGSMSGLAAATVARREQGPRSLTVVNRSGYRARRLADSSGGMARPWSELPDAVSSADIVITSTGAQDHVITADLMPADGRHRVIIDLALPRDVAPEVEGVHTHVVSLAQLRADLSGASELPEVQQATDLVTGEVAAYLAGRHQRTVAPTVTALRSLADEVIAVELARFDARTPALDVEAREEAHRAVRRVVDKLLHTPTVRVKELASGGDGGDYARALRELFDLDPGHVASVSAPPGMPSTSATTASSERPS